LLSKCDFTLKEKKAMFEKVRTILFLAIAFSLCAHSVFPISRAVADEDFAMNAAKGGQMEVALGRLAASKGSNAAVRSFGRRMVTDHTKAGAKLQAIAGKKGLSLPTEMDAEQKAELDRLSQLSGAAFDRAYMELMVSDHEKDVSEFETEANSGADPQLKTFAATTLPTLKIHLKLAKQTAAKVK
jgi:putative membrane protein